MTTMDDAMTVAARDSYLAIVSTSRADGSIQSSLVNAGAMTHPLTGEQIVAFVTYGPVKLGNLRARPGLAVAFRAGWRWAAVEGRAQLVGPDDPHPDVDPERLRLLLREVFTAAGGQHDDWEAYDAEMARQRRSAVLVAPTRIYGNA